MLYYGNYERQDEINDRIHELQKSSQFFEPQFSPTPLPTRNTTALPILVKRAVQPQIPIEKQPDFSTQNDFAPGKAPISGFLVDDESKLHNQFFALQRGGHFGEFIPSSKSDLYRVPVVFKPSVQPFQDLFHNPKYVGRQLPVEFTENNTFFNHTRQQLRGDGE